MVSAPQTIVTAVKPYVHCPNALWECIVQKESGFNPMIIGDNGTSFGLFQLHIGGQADAALHFIENKVGLSEWAAITYLMQNVDIQAQFGMPAINNAWNNLKGSFNLKDRNWWLNFCAMSGHPGGGPSEPATQVYVDDFIRNYVNTNAFGIQQMTASTQSGSTNTQKQDNTWLQSLINMPPHQPCNIIWRRSCPNAKNANEGGMDLPSPKGTEIHALGAGQVIGAGYFWHTDTGAPGYGVVTVRTQMADGTQKDVYYQHIQIASNIILCGQTGGKLYNGVVGPKPSFQTIQQGQLLGTNIVGEVEVGVNADWGGVWGTNHPGPWLDDPEDTIRSLMSSGGGVNPLIQSLPNVTTGVDALDTAIKQGFLNVHKGVDTISKTPGLGGPLQAFDDAQQFTPFSVPTSGSNTPVLGGLSYPVRLTMGVISFILNNTMPFLIRSIFVILALIVLIALIINITSRVTESDENEDDFGEYSPETAMMA